MPTTAGWKAAIRSPLQIILIRSGTGVVVPHQLAADRGIWLHVIRGSATVAGTVLLPGDAASLEEPALLEIQAGLDGLEALLFDLI